MNYTYFQGCLKDLNICKTFIFLIDYVLELCEWGPIYTLWSNSEDQLTCPLLAMSRAVDICAQTLKETVSGLI